MVSPAGQNEILACVPGEVTACVYMPLLRVPEQAKACWTNKPTQLYQQTQQIHEGTDTKHNSCLTCALLARLLPHVHCPREPKANPQWLTNASYVYWTQLNSSMDMTCCEEKKKSSHWLPVSCSILLVLQIKGACSCTCSGCSKSYI